MKKLINFMTRLEKENVKYSLDKSSDNSSIRVHIFIEPEYWCIDFSEDDEVEVEIYEHKKYAGEEDLSALFDRMAKAWQEAATDLKLEFVSPYKFMDASGQQYTCTGLIKKIGSINGTLIISRKDAENVFDAGQRMGYFTSGLNPRYYEKYNREKFIETLKEWGWFGEINDKPDWL